MNKKSNSQNPKKSTFGKEFKKEKKSFDSADKFSKDSKKPKTGYGDRKNSAYEDKPYRKSSEKSGEFKKRDSSYPKYGKKTEDREERSFKKPFDRQDRPYKKSFEKGDKPFRKPFDKEERPYKKSFEKGDKPFRKPFDKEERPYKKSGEDRNERKFAPKKKKSFGKFEDEDLSFGKRKQNPVAKPLEEKEEISFSKQLNKWEVEEVTTKYGKAEEKFENKNKPRSPQRGDFKRHFSEENPNEKVYSSNYESVRHKKTENYFSEENLEGEMPLNKFIAHCGICSRREAVKIIKEGKIKVNGELIDEPGHKVTTSDQVTLSGKKIFVQKNRVYILLNKAKGFITTTDDPKGRKTVMDIFTDHIDERIFPVGRLDRNTTGLLILTNDGELTQKLSHPKYEVRKIYKVSLDKELTEEHFGQIMESLTLEDGPVKVDQMEYLDAKNELGLQIHSGRNRIVRRIFESLGYEVDKLDRVMYANLTKKNLPRGKWRFLSKQEVINLKHLSK